MLDPNYTKFLAVVVVAVGAIIDWRTRKLPHVLTAAAALIGLALNFWIGGTVQAFLSLGGALLGYMLIELPQFLTRKKYKQPIGGGDSKLFAALGAILLPHGVMEVAFYFFLIYGIFGVLALARRKKNPGSTPTTIALGPLIAVATVLAIILEKQSRFWLGF